MSNKPFKALALALCLLTALTLTACHMDNDPWPASEGAPLSTDSPTAVPAAEPAQPNTTATPPPAATAIPGTPEAPADDLPVDETDTAGDLNG